MATDIGAVISIDGEKAFRTSLAAVNAQLKNLGSEMKAVVAEFAGMEDSQDAVTKKNDILSRSVNTSAEKLSLLTGESDRAKKHLLELRDSMDKLSKAYGENSEQALKAQNAYNKQVTVVNKLEAQINDTRASMKQMERQMKEVEDAAEDMADSLEEAGQKALEAKVSMKDMFRIDVTTGALESMADGIFNLVDSTTEYRKIMGTLEVSSQKAGYTAEQTAETYNQLYGILGDNQSAATAAANLQALGLSQEQMKKMTDGAIGAWATYGDSIPIDSLAEGINETVKAGAVTGTFADVLNWAGTSEDEFNARLAAAGTEAERVNLVLEELANQGLMDAAENWRLNNEEIVAANEATAALEETTGRLGEMLSPIVTSLKEGLNAVLSTLMDLDDEGISLIGIITGVSVALAGLGLVMLIDRGIETVGVITKMKTAFSLLSATMMANPILSVVALLAGLVVGLVTAYKTNDEFRAKVDAAWQTLKTSVGIAIETVKGFIDGLREKFAAFIGWLQNIPTEMQNLGRNVITGLWNGISERLEWVRAKVRSAVSSIKSLFTGITGFDTHSPSKWSKKVAGWVMEGMGNEFRTNTFALNAAGGAIENIKEKMNRSLQSIHENVASVATPGLAMAGVGGTTNNYTHGGINVYVDTVNNGNGRDTETIARELDFLTRQTAWGRGNGR